VVVAWLAAVALAAALPARHPLHTSVAEIRQEPGGAAVTIRVYQDDIGAAVPGTAAPGGTADSALAGYVGGGFRMADRSGRPVALRWLGAERSGEVLVIRLQAAIPGGLAGAGVSHALLAERFADQVNVVRAFYGGRTATLLFVPGDPPKPLP
jgi:hypothetical protein